MRVRVRLDTMKDIKDFVDTCRMIPAAVFLEDSQGLKVSAKSLIGASYSAMEFTEIFCTCEKDISGKLLDFII